jgi:hypothetical protein
LACKAPSQDEIQRDDGHLLVPDEFNILKLNEKPRTAVRAGVALRIDAKVTASTWRGRTDARNSLSACSVNGSRGSTASVIEAPFVDVSSVALMGSGLVESLPLSLAALAIPDLAALIFSAFCNGIRVDFHPSG